MKYALLILSVLTACGGRVTSPSAQLDWSIAATPASFAIGDSVIVVVTVTNRSAAVSAINSADCQPWIVTRADGSVVGPRQAFCAAVFQSRQLAPGESYTFPSQKWVGDATSSDPTSPVSFVAPGMYLIAPPKGRLGRAATVVAVAR
jgi:hypothetical protein